MPEALIIDACRTPRGIGKAGKGALSGIHPQQLGATVLLKGSPTVIFTPAGAGTVSAFLVYAVTDNSVFLGSSNGSARMYGVGHFGSTPRTSSRTCCAG